MLSQNNADYVLFVCYTGQYAADSHLSEIKLFKNC